jgi:hypothetical protein
MPKPSKASPPAGSNFLTYVTVSVVILGILGFFYLLFGDLFFFAVVIFGIIGGVACIHYFVWGRSMIIKEKKEAKAALDLPEQGNPSE